MALSIRRAVATAAVIVVGAGSLAACGANDAQTDSADGDGAKKIALLLPESKTTRYEAFDRPLFEQKVAELCDDCEVVYFNADQDPAKQQQQVETAITEQVDVMVLDPVDGEAAAGLVTSSQDADIPVIAYDRFIAGSDYYMSFDNAQVGKLQAEALVEAVGGSGSILMLNGAPTDPNAGQFKEGAHSVLDSSDVEILAEYDNPDWSPENAQKWTTDQLARFDASEIQGVYAANDGQAGGVIAALTGAGVKPADLPPVTGQDAELAAIQRIVAGEQAMTIYKSIKIEAEKAAEVAVQLANGEDVTGTTDFEGVPSFIFDPIVVTVDTVADTVVADGFWSVEEICTEEYADACADAGLQ
ncbi:MAG TPA: sugar ABC transporter substrate-binding protein [Nocardioidaceae bacterium]|nr:sugar ABC transporter substrate-binding protein [Nocardioidaceae bacterium]